MKDHRRPAAPSAIAATLAGLTLVVAGPGCVSSSSPGKSAAAVRPADFISADSTPVAAPALDQPPPARGQPVEVVRTGPVAASDGIFDVAAEVGPPTLSASDAGPIEPPRLVQAKVGDINGRAVYAMDFLAPMGDRFAAEAKKKKPADWMAFAEAEIRRELDTQIENELLMAEARDSLTPEQRQGFFAFLEDIRANLYSENRGSRAAANKKLFEEGQGNEEQWLRSREQEALIRHQLNEQINSKTVVSWREIRQSYERYYDRWNPPPRALFHIIRVANSKTEAVASMTAALEGGADFLSLAASEDNEWKRADTGLETREIKGDFAQGDYFGIEKLNEAARALQPGQWAGPIPWGSTSAWVYLEKIERESMSLFQAQLEIERAIRQSKSTYKRRKYVERMKAKASITDTDEMTQRLLAIAAERYLPGGAPPDYKPGAAAPEDAPRTSLK